MTHARLATLLTAIIMTLASPALAKETIWEKDGKRIDIFGDTRMRFEKDSNQREGKDGRESDRLRIRLRLGLNVHLNEVVEMGGRLATTANDSKSTHHSLAAIKGGSPEDGFGVDRGYIRLNLDPIWAWFGKNSNVVWDVMGITWDSDIQPEGFALGGRAGGGTTLWFNLGYYMLNETAWSSKDDTMLVYQLGFERKAGIAIKAAIGGYAITDQDENSQEEGALSVPGGSSIYSHAMLEASLSEMTAQPVIGFQYVSSDVDLDKHLGGGESSDKTAMVVYLKMKASGVKIMISYWDVGYAGATGLGYFSQGDFTYSTNYTGYKLALGKKLWDGLDVNLKYYLQEVKNPAIKPSYTQDAQMGRGNKASRIQLDLNVKF